MRKLIYAMNMSLDGFIETADGDIGWGLVDAELHQHFNDLARETGAEFYGRRLYELMSAYWPTADSDPSASKEEIEYAGIWRDTEKVVFSSTLDHVEGNARLATDDLATEIARLKAQDGKNLAIGGAMLAGSAMQLGLIDEFHVFVHPVVLGAGKPMFPALDQLSNLRLVETKVFGSGVVLLRYEREAG